MKPIIKTITPFDAENDNCNIEFVWNGNRPYANRLIIYNAETMNQIMDEKIFSYSLSHLLLKGTLINGQSYFAQISVFDEYGTESELSDKYQFYVFSSPIFEFNNISDGDYIENSSITVNITYQQKEFENINSYKFYLYDNNGNLIQTSDIFYNDSDIKYTYKGLENNSNYYIRCSGTTVKGMPID